MKKRYQNAWQALCQMQATLSQKITMRTAAVCMAILLAASLVPILWLGRYAHPVADDLSFGYQTRAVFAQTGSLLATVRQAAAVSAQKYADWQGSYTACFLMALQPNIWGGGGYAFVTAFLALSLVGGVFCFCFAFLRRLLAANGWQALFVGALLSFLCIQLVPKPMESFYWFNGSVYYLFFFALSLVQYALSILWLTGKKSTKSTLCYSANALLCVFVGGGNYITAAASALVALVFLAAARKKEKRIQIGLALLFLVQVGALLVSLAAPGNAIRQASVGARFPFVYTIVHCFYSLAAETNAWLSLPLLLWLAPLLPVFWRIVANPKLTFRFPLPAAVSLCSSVLFAACMFPHLYATGHLGPHRLYNMFFFMFVFLLVGNLLYWAGWCCKRMQATQAAARFVPMATQFLRCHTVGVAAAIACVSVVFCLASRSSVHGVYALHSLRLGEPQAYHQEMQQWEAVLQGPQQNPQLPPLQQQPSLFAGAVQLSEDPAFWVNEAYADYYQKQTVRLQGAQ